MARARRTPQKTRDDRPERVITTEHVAQLYGVTAQAVADWRHLGIGPDYFRTPGGNVRYLESVVLADLEKRTVRH